MIPGLKLKEQSDMEKGFIFNDLLCVDCKACSAACILENGWTTRPREIFTFNTDVLPCLPVINLSLACNHCEKPVCLEGCPSAAYSRESGSGAVVVDEDKCLGCSYCKWNCPYDAPKITAKGTIEKCNLCYPRISEGLEPACTSACPTGALAFGPMSPVSNPVHKPAAAPEWFPDKKLNPGISFSGSGKRNSLKIVPGDLFSNEMPEEVNKANPFFSSWSLIAFTFLTTTAVSLVCSSLIGETVIDLRMLSALLSISAVASLFHLGRKFRAWRAVFNIRTSPLSREIALFITFSAVSIISILTGSPGVLVAASITGLALLLVIDSVYAFSDNSVKTRLHAGQTFIIGLVLTSVLSGAVVPFIFLAVIKTGLSVRNIASETRGSPIFTLKFFRIALLLISVAGLATVLDPDSAILLLMIFTGELIDRLLFYYDFDPVNIRTSIDKNLNRAKDEKKNG